MDDKFWMVHSPTASPPIIRHQSWHDAREEAIRLASLNPGKKFYVLETAGVAIKQDVDFQEIPSVPF